MPQVTPVDVTSLSIEELKALKRRWFEQARSDGSIAAIARVARELGTCHPKKHGANWVWEEDAVQMVLDDWTGHIYVMAAGRQVFAWNSSNFLFVPGPWMDVIRAADTVLEQRISFREGEQAAKERDRLLRELGGY